MLPSLALFSNVEGACAVFLCILQFLFKVCGGNVARDTSSHIHRTVWYADYACSSPARVAFAAAFPRTPPPSPPHFPVNVSPTTLQVVTALTSDAHFLPELFLRLEKHTPDDLEWRDLVAFLQVRQRGGGQRGNSALVLYLLQVRQGGGGQGVTVPWCRTWWPFCR